MLGPLHLPAGGQRGNGGAVVIALAEQDLRFQPAMMPVRDLPRHLVTLLVRLRPRVGIVNPAQPRHLFDQPLGKQRARHSARRAGIVVQLQQLVAHRIGDAFAAIAHVHRPDPARYRIKIFAALGIPELQALAFDEHPRIDGFILLVLAQVVPDMGAVGLDDMTEVVGGMVEGHGGGSGC